MNLNLVRILLCVVLLAGLAAMLSCGSGTQPGNQGSQSDAANLQPTAVLGPDDACNDPDDANKVNRIRGRIIDKINKKLKDQLNVHKTFKFHVQKSQVGNYVEVYVEGIVYGSDELKDLADALNDFQKKGCLLKVFFVAPGTIKEGTTLTAAGFEWSACEYPEKPCPPDGACMTCLMGSNTAVNTAGNSNSGSNSNTSANANANVSSNSNSQSPPVNK